MDPDEDLCSVQRAGRLLGWSESKIRRHKDALGGREGGNGCLGLSLPVVLGERAKILSKLGAVEQPRLDTQARAGDGEAAKSTSHLDDRLGALETERARLAAEVVRLQEVIRSLLVADAALLDVIRQYANPVSPSDI